MRPLSWQTSLFIEMGLLYSRANENTLAAAAPKQIFRHAQISSPWRIFVRFGNMSALRYGNAIGPHEIPVVGIVFLDSGWHNARPAADAQRFTILVPGNHYRLAVPTKPL